MVFYAQKVKEDDPRADFKLKSSPEVLDLFIEGKIKPKDGSQSRIFFTDDTVFDSGNFKGQKKGKARLDYVKVIIMSI